MSDTQNDAQKNENRTEVEQFWTVLFEKNFTELKEALPDIIDERLGHRGVLSRTQTMDLIQDSLKPYTPTQELSTIISDSVQPLATMMISINDKMLALGGTLERVITQVSENKDDNRKQQQAVADMKAEQNQQQKILNRDIPAISSSLTAIQLGQNKVNAKLDQQMLATTQTLIELDERVTKSIQMKEDQIQILTNELRELQLQAVQRELEAEQERVQRQAMRQRIKDSAKFIAKYGLPIAGASGSVIAAVGKFLEVILG